jgi:hypothetical protein
MPSQRKQFNVRADDETEARVQRLLPLVKAAVGLEIGISDLFRLGMIELEKKYAATGANGAAVPEPFEPTRHTAGGPKKPAARKPRK